MTTLTQIMLGKSQAAQLRLSDGYAWHQALWQAFPHRDGDSRDFLFRIDDAGHDFRVLMLSSCEPKPCLWGHWQSKEVPDSFLNHPRYRFELRANPTMRRSEDSRRLGIYAEDRLRDWIHRKEHLHGFDIVSGSLTIGGPIDEFFVKGKARGKLVRVDFRGVLAVRDHRRFAEAFLRGIGSAKAFGFGLLMIEPSRHKDN